MFRLSTKKKKIKKYLAECVEKLSATIDEQTSVIKALSLQNSEHLLAVKVADDKLREAKVDQRVFKDQNTQLREKLERTKNALVLAEKETQNINKKVQDLEKVNSESVRMLKEFEMESLHLHTVVASLEERTKSLHDKNVTLDGLITALKADLTRAQSDYNNVLMKTTGLEKEKRTLEDSLAKEQEKCKNLEEQIMSLHRKMYRSQTSAYRAQCDLEAENECLKYDVNDLTKKLNNKQEELNQVKEDKLLVMTYYNRQLEERNFEKTQNPAMNTKHTRFVPVLDNMYQELDPDTQDTPLLQNRLCTLESQMFRKTQLVEDLVDIILQYDPMFNFEDTPSFKMFMDKNQNINNDAIQYLKEDYCENNTNLTDFVTISSLSHASLPSETSDASLLSDNSRASLPIDKSDTSLLSDSSGASLPSDTSDISLSSYLSDTTLASN